MYKVTDISMKSMNKSFPEIQYVMNTWQKCPVYDGIKAPFFVFDTLKNAVNAYMAATDLGICFIYNCQTLNARPIKTISSSKYWMYNFWKGDRDVHMIYSAPIGSFTTDEIYLDRQIGADVIHEMANRLANGK